MAIQQPTTESTLQNPDHALSHRVFANDDAAPVMSVIVSADGHVGVGGTIPDAAFHLPAGTSAAAPLKLQEGVALGTEEDGAMEYHDSHLYFTVDSTRHQLDGGASKALAVAMSVAL